MSECSWIQHAKDGHKGIYYPVLVLVPFKGCVPIKAYLPILCCEVCKKEAKVESFLSDEGWEQIKSAIEAQGKMVPKRELTTVEFISMEDAPKQNLVEFKP